MKVPEQIVIFHPAAIGDSVLATPVAAVLKKNFPDTKITYFAHASLEKVLLDYCPSVDDFLPYQKGAGLLSYLRSIKKKKPDLFIDLSNSLRGKILSLLLGCRSCTYNKQNTNEKPTRHAVDNFLASLNSVIETPIEDPIFPTIYPDTEETAKAIYDMQGYHSKETLDSIEKDVSYIALVPGVGDLRPHRGWSRKNWSQLLKKIGELDKVYCLLIGGPEEKKIGEALIKDSSSNERVMNLCGSLDIGETAAALALCQIVVSGDTGPAHIARAVGTKVIGLYGPTLLERSGPYGNLDFCLNVTEDCQCIEAKHCHLQTDPEERTGKCMENITPDQVFELLVSHLRTSSV